MYTPRMVWASFDRLDDDAKGALIASLVEALVKVNVAFLGAVPDTPDVYAAGVRYEVEGGDTDDWLDIPRVRELGAGDCEDLCAWRIATLRVRGEFARPLVTHARGAHGELIYHVRVQRADGSVEDPSARLGMPT